MATIKLYAVPEAQLIEVRMIKTKKGLFGGRKYLVSYNQTMMDKGTPLYTRNLMGWVKEIYTFDGNNYKELTPEQVEQYV